MDCGLKCGCLSVSIEDDVDLSVRPTWSEVKLDVWIEVGSG